MQDKLVIERFYLLKGVPTKVIWENGIITQIYCFNAKNDDFDRKDELAPFIEKEVSENEQITENDFIKAVCNSIEKKNS